MGEIKETNPMKTLDTSIFLFDKPSLYPIVLSCNDTDILPPTNITVKT